MDGINCKQVKSRSAWDSAAERQTQLRLSSALRWATSLLLVILVWCKYALRNYRFQSRSSGKCRHEMQSEHELQFRRWEEEAPPTMASINQSIHPPINPSIHPSITHSISQSINRSIITRSLGQFSHSKWHKSINQSINPDPNLISTAIWNIVPAKEQWAKAAGKCEIRGIQPGSPGSLHKREVSDSLPSLPPIDAANWVWKSAHPVLATIQPDHRHCWLPLRPPR